MLRRSFLGLALAAFLPEHKSDLQAGDIFLTRNAGGEINNSSPGYYNHSAIFSTNNWVIESQLIFNSVIAVPVWHFFKRYPEILVLRNNNPVTAALTAQYAPNLIGRHYSKIESVRPFWRWHSGDNCVSAIKRIYNQVTGFGYRWRIPDDFLQSPMFTKIALQRHYEDFVPPQNLYQGMVQQPPNGPPTQ